MALAGGKENISSYPDTGCSGAGEAGGEALDHGSHLICPLTISLGLIKAQSFAVPQGSSCSLAAPHPEFVPGGLALLLQC